MAKLTALRGLSGSGKSTRAAEIAKDTGAVIVNRDSLRKMLFNVPWTGKQEDEDRVTIAEKAQVRALLKSGTSVVSDNTYLNAGNLRQMAKIASQCGAEFEVVDIEATVEECIARDAERAANGERAVGEAVIRKQASRYPRKNWPKVVAPEPFTPEPVEFDPDLEDAVIFDIDGTLAHIPEGGRSPYDYTRVHEDALDFNVAWMNDLISEAGDVRVFIVSGRKDECRVATLQWLDDNQIHYDELLMRGPQDRNRSGGDLPDFIVKHRLFNDHIRGKYNIRMVFDDRDQVVKLWRQLGLTCAQVAYGNF